MNALSVSPAIHLQATNGGTNRAYINNVFVSFASTGVLAEIVGSGTMDTSLAGCILEGAFNVGGPILCDIGAPTPLGYDALALRFTNPSTGQPSVMTPTISGCNVRFATGSVCSGISSSISSLPNCLPALPIIFSPVITGTILDGSSGNMRFGMRFEHYASGVTTSPTITSCLVQNCLNTGILIVATGGGSPSINGTTVNYCGLDATLLGSINRNAITIRSQGCNGSLSPSIANSPTSFNGSAGIHIEALGENVFPNIAGGAMVLGNVTNCLSFQNGRDGFHVEALGSGAGPFMGAVHTTFNANWSFNNGQRGLFLRADAGGAGPENWPAIRSTFTNNIIQGSTLEGVYVAASSNTAEIDSRFTFNTVAYNGVTSGSPGILHPPLPNPPVFPQPRMLIYNCIVRFNGTPAPSGLLDITGAVIVESSQVFYTNYNNYSISATPNFNNGWPLVNPTFMSPSNLHLVAPPISVCGQIIDNATTSPPAGPPLDYDGQGRVFNFFSLCAAPVLADRGMDELR